MKNKINMNDNINNYLCISSKISYGTIEKLKLMLA
jgi:hypothetical protein